jgi:hypothetical protein
LPDDAFAEKFELLKQQDKLRDEAADYAVNQDAERTDDDLLIELRSLRDQMKAIEEQRIDLVYQAGTGGVSNMGNLGGVDINIQADESLGLSKIKARIGVIKGVLIDRGVDIPVPD